MSSPAAVAAVVCDTDAASFAELQNWGAARRTRLAEFVRASIPFYPDNGLCTLWASVVAEQRRRGQPIGQHDAWVAACAIYLDVPVVTHNAAHFRGVPGVRIITEPDP